MTSRNPVIAYGLSLTAIAAALALRLIMEPLLGERLPFITLNVAVVFSVWYGGRGPGFLALITGAIGAAFLILEPRQSLGVARPEYQIGLVLYGLGGLLSIAMIEALRRESRRVAEKSELLQLTLASIGDGVITTDSDGRITRMNAVAAALTGWSVEGGGGQPIDAVFRIVNEQTREPVENPAIRALREGISVGLANDTLLIARDGTERAIDDSASPILDPAGQLSGVVLVFRDVSERRMAERKLEASERDLADFFEDASIGIHWVAADGTIVRANRAELAMLGYEREEYVGRHIGDFHVDRDVVEDILGRLKAGEILAGREARMRCKDGSIRHVSIDSSVKWDEGRFVHTRCFTRDLSDRIRAEEAASRMAAIVTSSDDAILSKDLDGIIQTWNNGAESLFGYTAEEIIGRSVLLLIPRDRAREEDAILASVRRGQHVAPYETVRRRKDGTEIEIDLKVAPVFDAAGRVIGASKVARDLGPRRRSEAELRESRAQAERRLRELEAIYENVPIGMCLLDRELRYVRINDRLAEMNGVPTDQHIGRTVRQVVPLLADQIEPQLRGILETGRPIVEIELSGETAARPGVRGTWLESWFPQRDESGAVTGVNVAAQEITDRKFAEEELRQADRRKDEFLAILSHELRNPLAPIRNGLSILAQATDDPQIAVQTRQIMERQLNHLIRLVDDLFDVSRIGRGRIELQRECVELASIVSLAVETCRPMAEARSIAVVIELPDAPIQLEVDPVRMSQVVANLLSNACKFSEPGSEVRISGKQVGTDVQIAIEDTGLGIKPELLESVFEMFNQIDPSPDRQGLGIGLALAKRLVQLHGGRIVASSLGLGMGSQFVVAIPARNAVTAVSVGTQVPEKPVVKGRRILVVDDNLDSAVSLALWLRLKGHETHVAHDGREALIAAESFRPTVILLDIGLPKLDGYEVCRRIREETWGKQMRVIALTGWGQEDAKRATAAAGFDSHLVKPVDHSVLEQLLSSGPV